MDRLLAALASSARHRTLYHFTDRRNLASIAEHGLLSLRELDARGIEVEAPGGNQASHDIDARIGMDRYVHLCLLDEHPMEYRARQRGQIGASMFIRVLPAVLRIPGVLFTDDVANKAHVVAHPIAEIDGAIDHEVVYQRTEWKDPSVQERRQRMKRFEILVPDHVPATLLRTG